MLESTLEQHLVNAIHAHGGLCWKLTSPGTSGVPDRLCIFPGNNIAFVELKAPGKKPRPIQNHRINQLKKLQANVYIIDSKEKINHLISDYRLGLLE